MNAEFQQCYRNEFILSPARSRLPRSLTALIVRPSRAMLIADIPENALISLAQAVCAA
jgi:hypothetical protein